MTSFDKGLVALKKCYLTLKIPLLNKDGCWEYEHKTEQGVTYWSNLSADGKKTANRSEYKLSYEDKKVLMQKIATRQKLFARLIPISELETAKDMEDDAWDAYIEQSIEQ